MIKNKISKPFLRAAVKRMFELGLSQDVIIKIFAHYDQSVIINTLTHYKYVSVKIPEHFFIQKLKELSYFSEVDRRTVNLNIFNKLRNKVN